MLPESLDLHNLGYSPFRADKIHFFATPAFDPGPWLSPLTRDIYNRPSAYALGVTSGLPRVYNRVSRSELLRFVRKLFDSSRLQLFLSSAVADRHRVVVKSTPKDADVDRLITDARVANADEHQVTRAVKHLGLGHLWTLSLIHI